MSTKEQKNTLLPPWEMPPDPVLAVVWFIYWLLRVVVRFFWVPILAMVIYEATLNGIARGVASGVVGGVITFLVGLVVWAALCGALVLFKMSVAFSRILATVNSAEQTRRSPIRKSSNKVVEGTITDLDAERKKRRQE